MTIPTKDEIRIRTIERKTTLLKIAKKAGVTPSAISGVLSGKYKSARLEKAIAKGLGYDVFTLFPDHVSNGRKKKKKADAGG